MNNGGHAWNAVKLSGKWYMVDATNNGKSMVPYWICDSSSDFIYENGFVLTDGFVDGTSYSEYLNKDEKKDWYYENNLYAKTPEEVADIWLRERSKGNAVVIKYKMVNESAFANGFIDRALSKGVTEAEISAIKYSYGVGMIIIK